MNSGLKRDARIDNIRVFAIFSVVLGHSIILYSSNWNLYHAGQSSVFLDYVKRFINLYQMQLFFSLSGYLYAKKAGNESAFTFFTKKAKRLLVPFLLVGLFWMIPIKYIAHYPGYVGNSIFVAAYQLLNGVDTGHLWYLPTLFCCFAGAYIITKLFGRRMCTWVLAFSLSLIAAYYADRAKGANLIIQYSRYLCKYFYSFVLGVLLWIGKANLERVSRSAIGKTCCIVTSAVFSFGAVFFDERLSLFSSVMIVVSLFVITTKREFAILNAVSRNSYGIYLFHSPLLYFTFSFALNYPPAVIVAINFFIWGGVAYWMTSVLRKTPLKHLISH